MSVATNTHTSSHYATSVRRWVNEFLTFFGYPLFLGLSACHWWRQHVVLHHPAPNVIGTDNDVDLEPWFAPLVAGLRGAGRSRQHWIDLSAMLLHYVVWLAIPMAFWAPVHVAGFYALRVVLMGYAMFAVLAPGHFPLEAVCIQGGENA